ncbi:transmembrane protein 117-like [Hydractinia symbiolongicarpus]|uniref:transmembrane protein 117-like n=1 Tax=Hydractinia symbiolongicarpus TaxID=13093 RepID=UPI00254C7C36|nr:transmembrane protein 117-like [Hydractinia symbiolongicarpus]
MGDITVTPQLIKELQKFEAKKTVYMTDEDVEHEIEILDSQPKSFKYYFQHPNLRLLIACTVTILNFYIFAEDPVSHSVTNCHISLIGDIYSMIFANYPPNGYSAVKVCLWLFAIIFSIIVGKIFIHYWLFCCKLKLKLFSKEGQGSWMLVFLFTLCVVFYQSAIFNAVLILEGSEMDQYHSTDNMHIKNKTFMKMAAIVTWLGDFITAWMVLDMMLQEKKYHHWMRPVRRWWQTGYNRVIAFWLVCLAMTIVVVVGITTDFVNWDGINRGMVSTNELSRSFLASFILIFDLVIIMQDWDFPHFCCTTDVKLPGVHSNELSIALPACCVVNNPEVQISGKWFNYGILLVVMILDLYKWKTQIMYEPFEYGQYVNKEGKIFTVTNKTFLAIADRKMLTYEYRWNNTNHNGTVLGTLDHMTLSMYNGYPVALKGIAFIPSILAFFVFIYLVYTFAQIESDREKLVRNWYESKFIQKRKSRKIKPNVEEVLIRVLFWAF